MGAFGTPTPGADAVVRVPCLVPDVLGRRSMEPLLDARVAGGCCWMATRVVPPLWVTLDRSTMVVMSGRFSSSPRMLPCPFGEGNWVSLKSVEADSRLLWRSSKLTEGRKSRGPVVLSPRFVAFERPFRPPKGKRERLFEDVALSIGASIDGNRRRDPILVGLAFSLLLDGTKKKQSTMSVSCGET